MRFKFWFWNIPIIIMNFVLVIFGVLFTYFTMSVSTGYIESKVLSFIVGFSVSMAYLLLCFIAYAYSWKVKDKLRGVTENDSHFVYILLLLGVFLTPVIIIKIASMPIWGKDKYGNRANIDNVGFNGFRWGMDYDQFVHKKKMVFRKEEDDIEIFDSETPEYPVENKSFIGDEVLIGSLVAKNVNYWFDNNVFSRVTIVIPEGEFKKYKEQCFIMYGRSFNEGKRVMGDERYYWGHGDTFVQLAKDSFDGGQLMYESKAVEKKTKSFYKSKNLYQLNRGGD